MVRRNRPPRARPLSEGSFSVSFFFGVSAKSQGEDDVVMCSRADTKGSQSGAAGRSDITAMLEQVTLGTKPSAAYKEEIAPLPPRKLNFFSSMRLKRSETDVQTKDVRSILSKFRNKGLKVSLFHYTALHANIPKHPIIIEFVSDVFVCPS